MLNNKHNLLNNFDNNLYKGLYIFKRNIYIMERNKGGDMIPQITLKKIFIIILIIVVALALAVWATYSKPEKVEDSKLKIVTSFYPIYIMTSNLTKKGH